MRSFQNGIIHTRKLGPQTETAVDGIDEQDTGRPAAETSEYRQQSDQTPQSQLNPIWDLPNGKQNRYALSPNRDLLSPNRNLLSLIRDLVITHSGPFNI